MIRNNNSNFDKTTMAIAKETKQRWRQLKFPDYVKDDDSRIRYVIANFDKLSYPEKIVEMCDNGTKRSNGDVKE